jgi:hypothetical protein
MRMAHAIFILFISYVYYFRCGMIQEECMPLFKFGKKKYWVPFPSSELPRSLKFVPTTDVKTPPDAKMFTIHLSVTGNDICIGPNVIFECNTSVNEEEQRWIKKTIDENHAFVNHRENGKYYYAPVVQGNKTVGVLIGCRENTHKIAISSQKLRRMTQNQLYMKTFDDESITTQST